jgi:hypothetical protein
MTYAFPEARRLEARSWYRAITAQALSECYGQGKPEQILRSNWKNDDKAALILRSAVSPTTTGDFIVSNVVAAFRSIAPDSAALALFDRANMLDLSGVNSIAVPALSSLPTAPAFVGEGKPAPAVMWNFSKVTLGPTKKVLVLSAVTGELESCVPETASGVIGRVLSDRTSAAVDAAAFGTSAATTDAPAGLLYNVTPVTQSASADIFKAVAEDLGSLAKSIGAAGINTNNNIVYVAGPREAEILKTVVGARQDAPILTTLGLPALSVAAFAPSGIWVGYRDRPEITTSREALVHMEDTSPAAIGSVGTPPTVAAPARSAYQTWVISVKVRANCCWIAAPGACAVVNSVAW